MAARAHPDPDRGVFETLLVLDGEPIELEAHLERMTGSLDALYGASLPECAETLARERAVGLALGRLRLTVPPSPGAGDFECEATAAAVDPALHFPDREHGAALVGHRLPQGLGDHKWSDRSRLPATPPGTLLLLLDAEDDVLEAERANVFAVRDGGLVTPPLDGRILAGVTRGVAIELAHGLEIAVAEHRLPRAELFAAEEVFLTGSVRGIEPARSLDGEPLPAGGAVSGQLAEALRSRWSAAAAVAGS